MKAHSKNLDWRKIRRLLRRTEEERQRLKEAGRSFFIPSRYLKVFRIIADLNPAPGDIFIEWGCGFGTIALFAGLAGFESYGIEIDETFVDKGRELAEDFKSDVTLACGSYIPNDFETAEWDAEYVDPSYGDAYKELDILPCDADVIYVYPWPSDERLHQELFLEVARPGARLITTESNQLHLMTKPIPGAPQS